MFLVLNCLVDAKPLVGLPLATAVVALVPAIDLEPVCKLVSITLRMEVDTLRRLVEAAPPYLSGDILLPLLTYIPTAD